MPQPMTGTLIRRDSKFEEIIDEYTKIAQIQGPKDNVHKALVYAGDFQKQSDDARSTLPQRWQNIVADSHTRNENPSEANVDPTALRVLRAWRKFCHALPKEQAVDLEGKPPDFRFLQKAVEDANASLQTKRETSKVKSGFHKVCNAFNDFQMLAGMLPDGDMYLSLVTGSFGAMIKASANHENIAESVSNALVEISENMVYCRNLIGQYTHTYNMRRYVKDLYALVFECFAELFTEWHSSRWHRFKNSFNPDSLNKIVSRYSKDMNTRIDWLRRDAELKNANDSREATEQILREQRRLMAFAEHLQEYMQQQLLGMDRRHQELLRVGNFARQTLEDGFNRHQDDQSRPRELQMPRELPLDDPPPPVQIVKRLYTKQDLQHTIASLGLSLPSDTVSMPVLSTSDLSIEPEVLLALESWSKTETSSFLWIEGPFWVEEPSKNTLTSMSLIGIAQESEVALLTFFGHPTVADSQSERVEKASQAVLSLIQTLVSQLINALPENFQSDEDFSPERFASLADSVLPAIQLFATLLKAFPYPLIAIIDGLQHLSHGKLAEKALRELVAALCAPSDHGAIRRVCFTTDGFADVLGHFAGPLARVTYEVETEDGDTSFEEVSEGLERSLSGS